MSTVELGAKRVIAKPTSERRLRRITDVWPHAGSVAGSAYGLNRER